MNYIMVPMIKVFYHLKDRLQILQANLSELLQPLFLIKIIRKPYMNSIVGFLGK